MMMRIKEEEEIASGRGWRVDQEFTFFEICSTRVHEKVRMINSQVKKNVFLRPNQSGMACNLSLPLPSIKAGDYYMR